MAVATWMPAEKAWDLYTALPGDVVWYRSAYAADGTYSSTRLGTGQSLVDVTAPVDGSELTWTASNGYDDDTATATPDPEPLPVLSIPSKAGWPAVGVTVLTSNGYRARGRGYFYDVIGRVLPWLEPQPPNEYTGDLVLHLPHPGGPFPGPVLRQVRATLATGLPMLLRSTCPARVGTVAFAAEEWAEEHPGGGNAHGPDRRITIRWRAVEPLFAETLVVGRLWLDVPADYGTWAQVAATGDTWREVAYP